MLRKLTSKILTIRRATPHTTLDTTEIHHEHTDDAATDEPETSRIFRHAFIDKFTVFKQEADLLARGNAEFNEGWRDTLAREGIGLSAGMIGAIIALLGALSILSAGVSAGVSIPVIVLGVIASVAFYKYREHIKQQRYESASSILDRDDLNQEIHAMADMLAKMYQVQLASCTEKDAHKLAAGCVKAISTDILKNENFRFRELQDYVSLQAVLMRTMSAIPKDKLSMKTNINRVYNTRGLITHSAYYVRETDEFYQTIKSKPAKYGVLFFDTKVDLEDYETILAKSLRNGKKWKFTKMNAHEVDALMQASIFKTYQNDKIFSENRESGVEKKDTLRIV